MSGRGHFFFNSFAREYQEQGPVEAWRTAGPVWLNTGSESWTIAPTRALSRALSLSARFCRYFSVLENVGALLSKKLRPVLHFVLKAGHEDAQHVWEAFAARGWTVCWAVATGKMVGIQVRVCDSGLGDAPEVWRERIFLPAYRPGVASKNLFQEGLEVC